ncbi:sensor histidine kinase [Sedimentibacter sp. MB31-C6]|uniref:sensor histidine kinase n=1 Tax=Sedimentibacter sp. MB31-C6 TaxID=3109366 RepID=UPI002DDDA2E3|nr:HAMP domain-containing sensor histidine kinase [Sedimentibacter sp. MB36-C1]WSI04270.1 HAMP domain-containing sensor histidine kinase [Sedimentibacter sp. MB36-C1]
MKSKIANKLIFYFSATLVIFSIIIGLIFMHLFKKHTIEIQKSELENRAVIIANTISEFMDNTSTNIYNRKNRMQSGMMGNMQGGLGVYIKNLDDIAMADVWIVDENLNLITVGQMGHRQYMYTDLPNDADIVVKDVFKGSTTFSEGFSNLLNTATLTIGTPIKSESNIVGALLLHSPVEGINDALYEGFKILAISIIFGLVLSILLSTILVVNFTNPLKKMKNTALMLSEGNYKVKTNINQSDEIGELASTIDILSNRLEIASHESKKLQNLRRDFIANISHELRTPVTVIRGSLEALCDGVIIEPNIIKDYHKQMLNESKSLERLVNDLLDLSRLQNTDFQIDMQKLNLCDVLKDTIRSIASISKDKNIEVKYEQDTDICVINGDYVRLRQMFLIILDNAIKFSNINSIINVIKYENTVYIKDSGIGILKEDLPYIFDRFYKVKSKENIEGTGLGLAIAKQIADRHDIDLSVNSKISEGTVFKFVLP